MENNLEHNMSALLQRIEGHFVYVLDDRKVDLIQRKLL
jgi:hypothetical protein